MKKIVLFIALHFILQSCLLAQPSWVVDINALPDTGVIMSPVKMENGHNNSIVVLSNYFNPNTAGAVPSYIKVTKLDSSGSEIWSYMFGSSLPSANDMAVDANGDIYIVGTTMGMLNNTPLMLKISNTGALIWVVYGANAIQAGSFEKVYLHSSDVYAVSQGGISKWTSAGVEAWSVSVWCNASCIDQQGQIIFTGGDSLNNNFFRMSNAGTIIHSDSTRDYQLLKVDALNNTYALSVGSFPNSYVLDKYNSTGQLQWTMQQLPNALPFGDLSTDMVFDSNNDVILVGLADSIFKVSKTGVLLWTKSMSGADSYIIDASIDTNNTTYYIGTRFNAASQSNEITFEAFDHQSVDVWSNAYLPNSSNSIYATGLVLTDDAVYGLMNYNQITRVLKYPKPLVDTTDYSAFCVDSVWYDSSNAQLVHIRVVNSGNVQLNYPSIQMLSPTGSVVSNTGNYVSFFAQIPNTSMVYTDTILQAGIADFSNHTFRMSQNFGSSSFLLNWCGTTGLDEFKGAAESMIYPNPTTGLVFLSNDFANQKVAVCNSLGDLILEKEVSNEIDLSLLSDGVYFLKNNKGVAKRIVVTH